MVDKETKVRIGESLMEAAKQTPSLLKLFKSDKALNTFFAYIEEVNPSLANQLIDVVVKYREDNKGIVKGDYPIKATFECEDMYQLRRLAKSDDMAFFIWELVHNGWRDWKNTDYDYGPAWGKIHEMLRNYNINVDDFD